MAESFLKKKKVEPELPARKPVPVINADPQQGLSAAQVRERLDGGWANTPVDPPGKTVKQIIMDNTFTYFNLVFFILAVCICLVGQWLNLTFMGVVVCNTFIGIVQELRSKKTLDKLNILASPKANVIRDGRRETVDTALLVRDDIVVFASGNQIYADATVVEGECSVNEALVTGEADEIKKTAGDKLLSGSFIVNGVCHARLTEVGADSFASKLTLEAKAAKAPRQSEMMRSLTNLVKWIGFIVIPLGGAMFIKEFVWLDRGMVDAVTSTVGSIVGMIPEGLYLLTSLALVAGVLRLAGRKTLVHDMDCIETLARVDTLCVDKTGTITESKMEVDDVFVLQEDRFNRDDVNMVMANYVAAMQDDNDTMAALKAYFAADATQSAEKTMPFSSVNKYGGVSFHEDETYLMGAPEIILANSGLNYDEEIKKCSAGGRRVLLLAMYDGSLDDKSLSGEVIPIALLMLTNKIRDEAPDTFAYFASQGVAVKVISGDNPLTVSEVAKRAKIDGAERYVDARKLLTDEDIAEAAEKYVVFGRVTPDQKKKLVMAMKTQGHTVAMTGDGVNDVLALKEADCSIAMASGSDVACQASHIVLLDSNFGSMPSVVAEGRRIINNIERSASLFLVKNIFTFVLAFITLFFTLPYPFTPAQLSLVNMLTIGAPSFILAMEPNENLITGKFLRNVLFRALPTAMTDLVLIIGAILFYLAFNLDDSMLSTICTGIMGTVGLMMVFKTCLPFNTIRKIMMGVLSAGFIIAYFFIPHFFTLAAIDSSSALILAVFALLAWPVLRVFSTLNDKIKVSFDDMRDKRGKHAKKTEKV